MLRDMFLSRPHHFYDMMTLLAWWEGKCSVDMTAAWPLTYMMTFSLLMVLLLLFWWLGIDIASVWWREQMLVFPLLQAEAWAFELYLQDWLLLSSQAFKLKWTVRRCDWHLNVSDDECMSPVIRPADSFIFSTYFSVSVHCFLTSCLHGVLVHSLSKSVTV